MSISKKLSQSGSGQSSATYVDDLFSTYLYKGTGAAQDIVNGIDLANKGGLIWTKCRSNSYGNVLHDSEMAPESFLSSDGTAPLYTSANQGAGSYLSLNSDGYTIGTSQFVNAGAPVEDYVSWSFAKHEHFFDIVTYTGDDAFEGREIPHNLGSIPGMMIIKSTNASDPLHWVVWHPGIANDYNWRASHFLQLSLPDAQVTRTGFFLNDTMPTATEMTVGFGVNKAGVEYTAYLFGQSAPKFGPNGDEPIIKCGQYDGNQSTDGPEIDLGFEPQWLLIKNTFNADDWVIHDVMRGITSNGFDPYLSPNLSDDEAGGFDSVDVNATGFKIKTAARMFNDLNKRYIFVAIRRPMRPAKDFEPDELFTTALNQGTEPFFDAGFPVDMAWQRDPASTFSTILSSRLIQGQSVLTNSDHATAFLFSDMQFDYSTGWYAANNSGLIGPSSQSWMFRRAPGFFDVVTYEGNSVAGRDVPHSLAATPEMIWVKRTAGSGGGGGGEDGQVDPSPWSVWHESYGTSTNMLRLNERSSNYTSHFLEAGNAPPVVTDETFSVSADGDINASNDNYIAMLWASVPGICDIGTYTGNSPTGGTTQDIDCGFTNGARFVLIRRADDLGNWVYFDFLRGGGASLGFPLSLNNTDPQPIIGDYCFALPSGFRVRAYLNEWNINLNGAEYIYMAIA